MNLEFLVASDVERDSISLEVYRPARHQVMNIEETALIVAHALRFAGLKVREPSQ